MGAESTSYISRENAIERIVTIAELIVNKKYQNLELNSSEEENDIVEAVAIRIENAQEYLNQNLQRYTDKMIEDIIDSSYYRHSMYNNYFIAGKEEC
jgi:hypothetical protein